METLPKKCEYIRKFRYFLNNYELISKETNADLWVLTVKCVKNEIENKNKKKKR